MRNANVLASSASGDQRKSEWKSQQILQFYQNNNFVQRIQLFWQSHSFQLLNDTPTLFVYLSHLLLLSPHIIAPTSFISTKYILSLTANTILITFFSMEIYQIYCWNEFSKETIFIYVLISKWLIFVLFQCMKLFNLNITAISYETEEIAKCVHFLLSLSQWAYYKCFNKFYKYKRDFFIVEPCFIELCNWNGLKKMCVIHFKWLRSKV